MAQNPILPNLDAPGTDWQEIDNVIEQIAHLARNETSPQAFYSSLLDKAVAALAAVGGAVWILDGEKRPRQVYATNAHDAADPEQQANLIVQALACDSAQLLRPQATLGEGDSINPSPFVLLLSPWRLDESTGGVIEVFQRPGGSPAAEQGYLHFLSAISEFAAEFQRRRQLQFLRDRSQDWHQFEDFSTAVHQSLDLDETAFHMANDGRRFAGCDRLSVVVRAGNRFRTRAISGVDTVERRSNVVRQIEDLVTAVVPLREPVWHPGAGSDLAPQVAARLDELLDTTQARVVGVVPLVPPDDERGDAAAAVGALVVEQFDAEPIDRLAARVESITPHCVAALQNARRYQRIPAPFRGLGRLRERHLPRLAVIAAVLAVLFAVLWIPVPFQIEADGQLQPQQQRDVFAPFDGIVDAVNVVHGAKVENGSVVAAMRNPDLDLEFRRVSGELQTARKKLASIDAERLDSRAGDAEPRNRYGRLTAEREEIQEEINSLERQLEILQRQQTALQIRSPIAGEVLTWNVAQLLAARPVRRGQVLMTIGDLQGEWLAELNLPDHSVRHLTTARDQIQPNLDVTFILGTDPGQRHTGQVESVALRTEPNQDQSPVCRIIARFDRQPGDALRPGATVRAKLDCGRACLGYVWFHRLIEIVQTHLLF